MAMITWYDYTKVGYDHTHERYYYTNVEYHHHHAVGREATKSASITSLLLSIYLSAVRVMSRSQSLCLSASGFS